MNKVLNRHVGSKIKTFFVHVVGCPFTSSLLVKKSLIYLHYYVGGVKDSIG